MNARAGLAALVLSAGAALPGFGTIDGGGQHREHERITRAAVACAAADASEDCFQPRSIDQLAGHGNGFGAVGAPDRTEVSVPAGCFVVPDSSPGVGGCGRRVTHAALNKDTGLIDPVTGVATSPSTPRGRVGDNFAKAVTGAVVETRHQWQAFGEALRREYGPRQAATMTCVLTHDDPAEDCAGSARTVTAPVLIVVLMFLAIHVRRRRWPGTSHRDRGGRP
ncbi:hypothetical protein [Actinoplanes subglobosus]|uniref:Secreted protein n=1 Tax=Actinoplanes subglobosus TaxID=1547892 RepID=A0ABV8IM26_9ACTN